MKDILQQLIQHKTLTKTEAKEVLIAISEGKFSTSEIAAFITVYMMRSISLEELEGFRDALLELCIPMRFEGIDTIDLCGTGGDGKNTFNISTLASMVTAGAGVPVTKHGNYGISSVSGSSNVLEALGVNLSNDRTILERCLEEANICVLHAPLFHPAMKTVGPVRRELGVKTFFNMLGPLVNPAFPKYQMIGVFNLELARLYEYLHQNGDKEYSIVHALDGYDEISLTGPAKVLTNERELYVEAETFGVESITPKEIFGGGTVDASAALFLKILKGEGTAAQQNVVCANAAVAIATATKCSLDEGFGKAQESLASGKALQSLQQLQKITNL
ncbi:anthranilate phosphoribosyltransferase [Flavobacteriaceae bacterium TK19130]|nr:anthranilate phosphoribosyltransferase [Thermobacterium salinum]